MALAIVLRPLPPTDGLSKLSALKSEERVTHRYLEILAIERLERSSCIVKPITDGLSRCGKSADYRGIFRSPCCSSEQQTQHLHD